MRLLITGSFGFIGFNFLNYIVDNFKNDFDLVCIDSLESSCSIKNKDIFEQNESNYLFYNNKIEDIGSLGIEDVDVIINFAAETHVDNSIYNPEKFVNSNVYGLVALLKFAQLKGVSQVIHLSTDEVYGSIENGNFHENDILKPSSPYSASKAAAEHFCNAFSTTYGLNIVQLRPGNNYGIYQQPEKMIPFSVANLVSGKNIEVYGDGKNVRHWLHAEDTSRAILQIINNKTTSDVFNIGSGFYLNNLELSYKILNILNLNENRLTFVDDRPGHDFRYATDFSKLTSTGWKPTANFDVELEKTVNWYVKNKSWWFEEYIKVSEINRSKRKDLENSK
jgi:dTDP-glucose 4,6-dehydratase